MYLVVKGFIMSFNVDEVVRVVFEADYALMLLVVSVGGWTMCIRERAFESMTCPRSMI